MKQGAGVSPLYLLTLSIDDCMGEMRTCNVGNSGGSQRYCRGSPYSLIDDVKSIYTRVTLVDSLCCMFAY